MCNERREGVFGGKLKRIMGLGTQTALGEESAAV